MDRRHRAIVRQAQRLVSESVIDGFEVRHGGKHPQIVIRKGEAHRAIPFAGSPRTGAKPAMFQQDVRRKLREMVAAAGCAG